MYSLKLVEELGSCDDAVLLVIVDDTTRRLGTSAHSDIFFSKADLMLRLLREVATGNLGLLTKFDSDPNFGEGNVVDVEVLYLLRHL